ncbi:hypothetical protein JKF63_04978 [Porcisia hertigi]|uniref:BAR domain-containing protein n=1 Tax=Porcisia hertigi TaxID=2761500 RepID=A0A836LI65_9TRYP|nr:hypothetical protein JKF63_04978 [Porcisia hertigi]
MKKLVLDTKTALGMVPKTVDLDFDAKVAMVKTIEQNLSNYTTCMEGMKLAAESLAKAVRNVSVVLEAMTADDDIPASMKSLAADHTTAAAKISSEYLLDYKKVIDDAERAADIKALVTECKHLGAKRNKIRKEYDNYRDVVNKKEAEYRKKGKDLGDSKHYVDELNKRDALKRDFDATTEEYKRAYDNLSARKVSSYMTALTKYTDCTFQLLSSLEGQMATLNKKAELVTL